MPPINFNPLVDDLEQVYHVAAQIPLPKPRAIALRLIEEVVELCLACGASPSDIHLSVHKAMHNEHTKHPMLKFGEGVPRLADVAGELADVSLLTAFVQRLAGVDDETIMTWAKSKIARLVDAQNSGNLHFIDGRIYRSKEP